jgi:hypothetical protein
VGGRRFYIAAKPRSYLQTFHLVKYADQYPTAAFVRRGSA